MKKRILAILLAVVLLCIFLTSCGVSIKIRPISAEKYALMDYFNNNILSVDSDMGLGSLSVDLENITMYGTKSSVDISTGGNRVIEKGERSNSCTIVSSDGSAEFKIVEEKNGKLESASFAFSKAVPSPEIKPPVLKASDIEDDGSGVLKLKDEFLDIYAGEIIAKILADYEGDETLAEMESTADKYRAYGDDVEMSVTAKFENAVLVEYKETISASADVCRAFFKECRDFDDLPGEYSITMEQAIYFANGAPAKETLVIDATYPQEEIKGAFHSRLTFLKCDYSVDAEINYDADGNMIKSGFGKVKYNYDPEVYELVDGVYKPSVVSSGLVEKYSNFIDYKIDFKNNNFEVMAKGSGAPEYISILEADLTIKSEPPKLTGSEGNACIEKAEKIIENRGAVADIVEDIKDKISDKADGYQNRYLRYYCEEYGFYVTYLVVSETDIQIKDYSFLDNYANTQYNIILEGSSVSFEPAG